MKQIILQLRDGPDIHGVPTETVVLDEQESALMFQNGTLFKLDIAKGYVLIPSREIICIRVIDVDGQGEIQYHK